MSPAWLVYDSQGSVEHRSPRIHRTTEPSMSGFVEAEFGDSIAKEPIYAYHEKETQSSQHYITHVAPGLLENDRRHCSRRRVPGNASARGRYPACRTVSRPATSRP